MSCYSGDRPCDHKERASRLSPYAVRQRRGAEAGKANPGVDGQPAERPPLFWQRPTIPREIQGVREAEGRLGVARA